MLIDSRTETLPNNLKSEVCILGCGVAGTVLALKLKEKYRDIAIIEAGSENYDPESQIIYRPNSSPENYSNPEYNRLRMLGGSSNHWENNTSPFNPIDFEKRDWVEHSGWPINFNDIAPYYDEAAIYCGAGTDGYKTKTWEQKLNQRNITDGSSKIETAISIFSSPPVRFFERYGEQLIKSENVKIFKNANVVDIEFDDSTKKVTGIYFETSTNKKHYIESNLVIMCFGGIENARMLLHFNQRNKNEIGNKFDNVGRFFMDHPVVEAAHFFPNDMKQYQFYSDNHLNNRFITAYLQLQEKTLKKHKLKNIRMPLIPRTNYYLSDGISSFHILKNSFGESELPEHFGTHILNFIQDIDMVAEGVSRKQFEHKLFSHADDITGFMIYMMIEQSPDRNNRIKLSNNKDKFGVPKIDIDWKLSNKDKENTWKVLELVAQDLGERSLGRLKILKEREARIWGEHIGFGYHHMGTTRMSEHYSDGVVDKNQKVFGTKNLYIAGSSVFPTGSHVPPTLTIVATTIRLANHLSNMETRNE